MPLLVEEATSAAARVAFERDPAMSVWWAAEVECVSALARLERAGELAGQLAVVALQQLDYLIVDWHEVLPTASLRIAARRLLRVHSIRAADALQLAAALAAAEGHPASLEFVSLDERLIDAAQREGFPILQFRSGQG